MSARRFMPLAACELCNDCRLVWTTAPRVPAREMLSRTSCNSARLGPTGGAGCCRTGGCWTTGCCAGDCCSGVCNAGCETAEAPGLATPGGREATRGPAFPGVETGVETGAEGNCGCGSGCAATGAAGSATGGCTAGCVMGGADLAGVAPDV